MICAVVSQYQRKPQISVEHLFCFMAVIKSLPGIFSAQVEIKCIFLGWDWCSWLAVEGLLPVGLSLFSWFTNILKIDGSADDQNNCFAINLRFLKT